MAMVKKVEYPDIFFENEEMTEEDKNLFSEMLSSKIDGKEREFFEKMKEKEEGEFAPSCDIILDEEDNHDELYIIRYAFDEYRIGRGKLDNRCMEKIYAHSLREALYSDLFFLLGRHISLLEWLRENNFKGIQYFGNIDFE